MIERLVDGIGGNVIALVAHGQVSHKDYELVVFPAVKEMTEIHGKVRLFFQLGDDFTGYTAEAIWDDAKVGTKYFNAFEKIAVVSDVAWIAQAVRIFRVLVPCPVEIFPNNALLTALHWIVE